eukprot:gene33225-40995_t
MGNSPYLYGQIPESLSNLPLTYLSIVNASLTGQFPVSIFEKCTALRYIFLFLNYFTGNHNLDVLFSSNDGSILYIDMSQNLLTGQLPTAYYDHADYLGYLFLNKNHLTGTFPEEFTELPSLRVLEISDNHIVGTLPSVVSEMESLIWLFAANCHFTGTIPASIGNMTNLQRLRLNGNFLEGSIPDSFAGLESIQQIFLFSNSLTGWIPTYTISSLHNLEDVLLQNNHFSGQVSNPAPSEDGQRRRLSDDGGQLALVHVDFSNNRLTGTIPWDLFTSAPGLKSFAVGKNCIQGTLPEEICGALSLEQLMLDGMSTGSCADWKGSSADQINKRVNRYSDTGVGSIPECLFNMPSLTTLHLSGNGISGTIPCDKPVSRVLQELSLSHNQLIGSIPHTFQTRTWQSLDLSYNKLTDSLIEDFAAFNQNSTLMTNVSSQRVVDNLTWELLRKIKRMFLRVTLVITAILLPVYIIFTAYYKTYLYSYAWSTSAVFLSGVAPSVVALACFKLVWNSILLPASIVLLYRKPEVSPEMPRAHQKIIQNQAEINAV